MGKLGGVKKGETPVDITKNITAAGTPEQLSTSHIFCEAVTVQVKFSNTGTKAVVGFSNAIDIATNAGTVIAKGNGHTFSGVYLDELWGDVDTSGDGFNITYKQSRNL